VVEIPSCLWRCEQWSLGMQSCEVVFKPAAFVNREDNKDKTNKNKTHTHTRAGTYAHTRTNTHIQHTNTHIQHTNTHIQTCASQHVYIDLHESVYGSLGHRVAVRKQHGLPAIVPDVMPYHVASKGRVEPDGPTSDLIDSYGRKNFGDGSHVVVWQPFQVESALKVGTEKLIDRVLVRLLFCNELAEVPPPSASLSTINLN
jgi:hypothetical protein